MIHIESMPRNRASLMEIRKEIVTAKAQADTLDTQRKLLTQYAQTLAKQMDQAQREVSAHEAHVASWVGVFAEPFDLTPYVVPIERVTTTENIGSTQIMNLEEVIFSDELPDPYLSPLWVDGGIKAARLVLEAKERFRFLSRAYEAIEAERRRVTRLFNFMTKIYVPSLVEGARVIQIDLDDQSREAATFAMIAKRLQQKKKQAKVAS